MMPIKQSLFDTVFFGDECLYAACVQHWTNKSLNQCCKKQESPAIADKPARRESLPKIAPIRRAHNVVADDTGLSSFV